MDIDTLKKCKQCGELRDVNLYRKYYGGRLGRYRICQVCERINGRMRYLQGKPEDRMKESDVTELEAIRTLYKHLEDNGLTTPLSGRNLHEGKVIDEVSTMLASLQERSDQQAPLALPQELQNWYNHKLAEEPEHYLETIYDDLVAKYRPVLRIDAVTREPVYDDTYDAALSAILDRFCAYEDEYYNIPKAGAKHE